MKRRSSQSRKRSASPSDHVPSVMSKHPWFHAGLRFQCTGCGQCCTGGPGFVWVNSEEISQLAQHLKLPVQEFRTHYVRRIGKQYSLGERSNGDCVFLDPRSRQCKVYPVRPRQCRSWPFWLSNLRTPADWEYVCRVCPGSGQGPLFTLQQIQSLLWWSGLERDEGIHSSE